MSDPTRKGGDEGYPKGLSPHQVFPRPYETSFNTASILESTCNLSYSTDDGLIAQVPTLEAGRVMNRQDATLSENRD